MLHASDLSRNVAKSRGSFYFSCNSQRNNCSSKMGCYTKHCVLQLATQRLFALCCVVALHGLKLNEKHKKAQCFWLFCQSVRLCKRRIQVSRAHNLTAVRLHYVLPCMMNLCHKWRQSFIQCLGVSAARYLSCQTLLLY